MKTILINDNELVVKLTREEVFNLMAACNRAVLYHLEHGKEMPMYRVLYDDLDTLLK